MYTHIVLPKISRRHCLFKQDWKLEKASAINLRRLHCLKTILLMFLIIYMMLSSVKLHTCIHDYLFLIKHSAFFLSICDPMD